MEIKHFIVSTVAQIGKSKQMEIYRAPTMTASDLGRKGKFWIIFNPEGIALRIRKYLF